MQFIDKATLEKYEKQLMDVLLSILKSSNFKLAHSFTAVAAIVQKLDKKSLKVNI